MTAPTAARVPRQTPVRRPSASPVLRGALLVAPALVSGCLSYSPRDVAQMSAYDLCEAQLYSRVNLTVETRSLVDEELRKRNEDCRGQVPLIEARRQFEVDDAMYGRSGP